MLLLIAAIFSAAGGIHYQPPVLGPMAAEFGADTAQIGWIPTATFGGFLAGIALLAPLGDRMDKRALILRQHFACIVALLAAAAAPTPPPPPPARGGRAPAAGLRTGLRRPAHPVHHPARRGARAAERAGGRG